MVAHGAERRVREIWRAFHEGGVEAALPLIAEDVRWRPFAGEDLVLEGRDAMRRFLEDLEAQGHALRASIGSVECESHRVLVHGRLRHDAPGRIADDDVWWECRLRDGLLAVALAHHSRPA